MGVKITTQQKLTYNTPISDKKERFHYNKPTVAVRALLSSKQIKNGSGYHKFCSKRQRCNPSLTVVLKQD